MFGRTNRPSLGQHDFALRESVINNPPSRPRANSRFHEIETPIRSLQQLQGSSSSDDSDTLNPKSTSKHSRSMSHPFPSLFSSKKKKNAGIEKDAVDDDDSLDSRGHTSKLYSSSSQATGGSRAPLGPNDFATGNCMTCAGLVRWPKELEVFRCTKCLTINDLKPYTPTPRCTIRAVPRVASQVQSTAASPLGISPSIRALMNSSFICAAC
jgi:E3 ubiquitin-protein ligase HECTD2